MVCLRESWQTNPDSMMTNTNPVFPTIQLRKRQERRAMSGHSWIYSNEIETARIPLTTYEPGQIVNIETSNGQWIGNGYVNPHSLIAVRIVSRDRENPLSESLIADRLKLAAAHRDRIYDRPYYRLIYGESDFLPGVVIDRFDDVFVTQITTAGMELLKDAIVNALQQVFAAKAIVLRCDNPLRKMENLELYSETIGTLPEEIIVEENGAKFSVDLNDGQKTGWFYDQRDNRAALMPFVKGKTVVDVCSYIGAWGIGAAVAGAKEVICVDVSEKALEQVAVNAELNNVEDRVIAAHGDAFDILKSLRKDKHKSDIVILDPPAFVKRKKDLRNGTEAYTRLMRRGLQIVNTDGILVTCSCSYHMPRESFIQRMSQASRDVEMSLQWFREGRQGMDHPVHPAMPETEYLKVLYARVLGNL
jgi:23S rRNA (cytosine1962-C5)-methyltransferase